MPKVMVLATAGFLFSIPAVEAQVPDEQPERALVEDLLLSPGRYDGKLVIVVGELRSGDFEDTERGVHVLRGDEGLREVRAGAPRGSMSDLRFLVGQRVEVTGIFWDLATQCFVSPTGGIDCYDHRIAAFGGLTQDFQREDKRYFIGVRSADPVDKQPLSEKLEPAPSEEPPEADIPPGDIVDLRELVKKPASFLDKRVSVVGKFRGNNLYGDLSMQTKKTPRDFVIKVADVAIWVTGRRPRGKGFELNPRMRRDTGSWLKVTGVPWAEEGSVYLKAERIELVDDPGDPTLEPVLPEEKAKPSPPAPPPQVTFSLPLDGEQGIALDTEFRVQFSADMKGSSFDRNVDLLYADDDGTGNPFPNLQIRYEPASHTLVVIPGQTLKPEKEIRLILYGGIVGADGQPLVASSPVEGFPGALAVLSFVTGSR